MPSGTPDKKEQEPITDQQCVDAMKQGNFELVKDWYAEQEPIADQDAHRQGYTDAANKIRETIEGVVKELFG